MSHWAVDVRARSLHDGPNPGLSGRLRVRISTPSLLEADSARMDDFEESLSATAKAALSRCAVSSQIGTYSSLRKATTQISRSDFRSPLLSIAQHYRCRFGCHRLHGFGRLIALQPSIKAVRLLLMSNDERTNGGSEQENSAEETIRQLCSRVEELERRLQADSRVIAPSTPPVAEEGLGTSNRRSFLRLAGVAATGLAVSALGTERAAAADNGTILQGSGADANNTNSTMTTVTTTSGTATTSALRGIGPANSNGVIGRSSGSLGAGVWGESDLGYGVFGSSSAGYDLYAGGNGRIGLQSHLATGTPSSGSYDLGDIIRNSAGDVYICTVKGAAPSVAKFQKIAGPAAAGAIHLLPTPVRTFDSRASQSAPGPKGFLSNGWEAAWSLAGIVPAGSTAAIISMQVFQTSTDGFLTAYEDGTANPGTINCFWSPGMQISSTTFVRLNSALSYRVRAAFSGGQSNCAIDLLGYIR
jgi:hypothetical protein